MLIGMTEEVFVEDECEVFGPVSVGSQPYLEELI